jgi:anti-anti-sigma factor
MRRLTVRAAAVMPDTGWMVVPLPERISSANAGLVRKRLSWVIDHGAAVLVADLTATVSCDSSGTAALLQVYQHGVAAGTELRLVVTAEAVRRSLRIGGLAHLVQLFPTPGAALADLRESCRQPGQVLAITAAVPLDPPGAGKRDDPPRADVALLDSAAGRVFEAAMSLHDPACLSPERLAGVLGNLKDAIHDISEYVRAANGTGRQPGSDPGQQEGMPGPIAQNAQRTAAQRRQLTATAQALHTASADTAALMEQRRGLVAEPHRIEYSNQVKRWQAIAHAAQRMAEIYEDAQHSRNL